jgi:hypothetical protein
VEQERGSPASRSVEIGRRLGDLNTRMAELSQDGRGGEDVSGRLAAAQRNLAAAQAAAERAIVSSINAFHRSARVHEQVACQHERAAAAGMGEREEHQQRAASHRVAAAADRQFAERAQALLPAARAGADSEEPGPAGKLNAGSGDIAR